MERLDDLSLRHISRFLDPEDIIRVGRTCKRMYSAMPRVVEWRGKDFKVNAGYYCRPELYFDGPELSHTVQKLNLSVTWHDQGWGNRKGELWLNLMRRLKDGGGEPAQIASYRPLFGLQSTSQNHLRQRFNIILSLPTQDWEISTGL